MSLTSVETTLASENVRRSITLSRVTAEKPKEDKDAEAKILEPLLPPRFQRGHSYPTSVTGDEKYPLSTPDPPSLVLLGKLLRSYAAAAAVSVALLGALGDHVYGGSHASTIATLAVTGLATMFVASWLLKLSFFRSPVYLIDVACFGPPQELRVGRDEMVELARRKGYASERNLRFCEKIVHNSGLGPATAITTALLEMAKPDAPVETTLQDALHESEWILHDCVDALLRKTGVHPKEIDVIITSCSCFAPTPSMAAMILNMFNMRSDVLTYSLAGMGCSSSLICVDMAKHLLKAKPDTYILVVNHENITNCWYRGNDPHMMVVNCLFRMGGAAALLSNKPRDARRAKYELVHSVRTHTGNEDEAFLCMGNGQDADAIAGVFLRKTVISVAGKALKKNLRDLAPKVLPWTELVKAARNPKYVPNFRRAFDHFLLHPGGRGVLDSLEEQLRLTPQNMKASRETLYRFGNVSAASTWYILAYLEQNVGIKRGQRIWQLGFGGGFKANSAVWRARRDVSQTHPCWAPEWPAAPHGSLFGT